MDLSTLDGRTRLGPQLPGVMGDADGESLAREGLLERLFEGVVLLVAEQPGFLQVEEREPGRLEHDVMGVRRSSAWTSLFADRHLRLLLTVRQDQYDAPHESDSAHDRGQRNGLLF